MGRNLGPLNIKDSYEGLVQISGSQLTDGSGSLIPSLDVTASVSEKIIISSGSASSNRPLALTSNPGIGGEAIITNGWPNLTWQEETLFVDTVAGLSTENIGGIVTSNISASGYISASEFIGPLTGNALTATSASYATTASYAATASLALALEGGVSLQSVLDAGNTATQDFNLTGSVDIIGNLDLGGTGNSISGMLGSAIVVGSNQTISGGGDGGIYSGRGNTISTGLFGATLGGDGNTNSHNRSVVIGGAGLSTTKDDEVVVPSLVANSITASFASFQSASIGYLQSITGSAKIIGDAFIILNNNTPTERYAGLVVQDSGSTNNTASFEFDGQTNDWFYEYTDDGGATTEHGVALFGAEYNTKGSPSYPATNVLQKGNGGHHLLDSSITDDGTLVSIDANVSASGYVSASSFIGDGSQLSGISTSPFPYTGSAEITGSLEVIGNIQTGTSANNVAGDFNAVIAGASNQTTAAAEYSAVIGGVNSTISGDKSVIAGCEGGNITDYDNFIGGGFNQTINANKSAMVGGNSSTIAGGANNVIVAGTNHSVNGDSNVVIGGANHVISNLYERSVVIGGNTLSATKDDEVVVPDLSVYGAIRMDAGTSYTNDIYIIGSGSALPTGGFGGENIYIGNDNTGAGRKAIVIGQDNTTAFEGNGNDNMLIGWTNQVVSPNFTRYNFALGYNNTIRDRTHYGAVVGGANNDVGASALGATINYAGVFAGTGNTAIHNRSVVVGGQNLTTTKDDEVVVPSLSTNGAVVQNVEAITITSNTGSLDASTGNLFTMTLQNGVDTHLELTNQVAGQTFQVQITNNATSAGTITFDSQFEFEGGTPFTATASTNAVDILTFTCFGGGNVQCVSAKNFS